MVLACLSLGVPIYGCMEALRFRTKKGPGITKMFDYRASFCESDDRVTLFATSSKTITDKCSANR